MATKKIPPKDAKNKVGEYGLISTQGQAPQQPAFVGYHAREDVTTLPPSALVYPSKNVMMKTSGRIALVNGYKLDGAASSTNDSGILSNYDFQTVRGSVRNLRAGWLTSAGNDGKLQYRYADASGNVTWRDLMTGLTNVRLSYTTFWDTTEKLALMLWVDSTNNIFEWNGALATFASCTSNTITLQGSSTWDQLGFYATRNKQIVINGTTYTYTGGDSTTTLTGVTPDPTGAGYAAGTVIHQLPVTTALSSMASISATFAPTVLGCGKDNQLYVGSSTSNYLYVSKVNNYKDYGFSAPRTVGEGMLITLVDGAPNAIVPSEVQKDSDAYDMYISCGQGTWATIRATLSADLTKETVEYIRLKTNVLQGAKSERLVTRAKNHIAFVANDSTANFFGYISYQYVPVITDFSYPIIDDMSAYDFTDGQIFYYRNYILIAIPKAGLIRVYNMTNQSQESFSYSQVEQVSQQPWFWEAPVTYPISGFYVVNGEIYGHAYTTSESYKLFTGGNFNGADIEANATFAYDAKGDRTQSKASTEIWVEGYIGQNTTLTATVSGDLDSFATSQSATIAGNDAAIVAFGTGAGALGKRPIGSLPIGGSQLNSTTRPAWFHVAKTYPAVACYLEQISFSSRGKDQAWELITFGTNSQMTNEGNSAITQ